MPKETTRCPKVRASDVVKGSRGAEQQANEPDEETSEIVEHSGG